MRFTKLAVILAIPTMLFALAGCGSDSSGAFNPTTGTGGSTGGGGGGTGGTTGTATMTLTTDRTSVDVNIGQVLATATLKDADGAAIAGRPVTFSVVAGPATVDAVSVTTDTSGTAKKIVYPGNATTTTNVIIQATTTVGTQTVIAYANFQLVRGTGVITFITGKDPSDPDGTLITLEKTVGSTFENVDFVFMQQLPFKVTDANGNPRVGVPVTLSIQSQLTNVATVDPLPQTITTDSAGTAIFNVGVTMTAPLQGQTSTDSIIYKAVTTETAPTPSLVAYGGCIVSMTTEVAPLTIIPGSANFAAVPAGADLTTTPVAAKTLTFTVAGGVPQYSASSSNSGRVSVSVTGNTVTATLVDSSAWTETVTITVTDQTGKTANATITRQ